MRAAYEAEQTLAEPRVCMRRVASTILIACTPDLAAYAERLGRLADQLAATLESHRVSTADT